VRPLERIRIACANRGAGTGPVLSAVEGGYFKANGLEPELIFYPGDSLSLPALVAGEADFTNAVSPELITVDVCAGGAEVIIASAIKRWKDSSRSTEGKPEPTC
jgi:ABC-type nitrate/sulfonate/bicarbonate transport system substrate-binding protein